MDRNHGKYMVVLYTKPADCGGACLYCISEPGLTRSTLLNEDTLLARTTLWSSSAQLLERLREARLQLGTGLKLEMRIKGNSFTNYDPDYLEAYIKDVYDVLNGFVADRFEDAFRAQATAPDRCVQIVVETRPDQITEEWCRRMVGWGVTTVELGVQSLSDEVLYANRRGHCVDAVVRASALVRHFGFELGYQVMVGLIDSTREGDRHLLTDELWEPDFYPDSLKIYPCVATVNESAQKGLYRAMRQGRWSPYSDEEYSALLNDVARHFPADVHVNRVQRIMGAGQIKHGPSREVDRSVHHGLSRCMWQRSFQQMDCDVRADYRSYSIVTYRHGQEWCLQAVTRDDTLLAYARLSLRRTSAQLRDLRVLGQPLAVGQRNPQRRGTQHIGIGSELLGKATEVARAAGAAELRVSPSAGTWEYFLRRGFVASSSREQTKNVALQP
jgi:elongator complex protein 3